MALRTMLALLTLIVLGTPVPDANAQGYAGLTVDIEHLGGDESIPAGSPGQFRVTIRNGGPDTSTNTHVWIAWFRTTLTDTIGYDYSMRPSQGICNVSYTPDPDCYVGMIPVGGSVEIRVDGRTEPGRLSWYTLRVWAGSDQAAKTLLAEYSKGTSVTVAESGGGGALGWLQLLALAGAAVLRRPRKRRGRGAAPSIPR